MCQHIRPTHFEKRGAFKMAYSPYLDRAQLKGKSAIAQMALDFLMFAANAGAVCETDLEILGWTRTQVVLHASDARQYANRRAEG
jgi:hypothetical protein